MILQSRRFLPLQPKKFDFVHQTISHWEMHIDWAIYVHTAHVHELMGAESVGVGTCTYR